MRYFTREHLLLAAAVLAVIVALAPVSIAHAGTFEINMDGLMDTAANIFNAMWAVFAIVVGIGLGLFILKFVLASIKDAAGSG